MGGRHTPPPHSDSYIAHRRYVRVKAVREPNQIHRRAGVCHGRSLGTFRTPVQAAVEKIDAYISE